MRAFKTVVIPTQEAVELTVSGGATPTNTSHEVRVAGAYAISIQARNGSSTDLDVEVYTSPDNVTYDDEVYASMNLGANKEKTIPVTVGPVYMKVKVVNNDNSNATTVTVKVTVTK